MKPSEKRALEAEKRAQKEASEREKLLEAKAKRVEKSYGAPPPPKERMNADGTYKKLPEEEIEVKGDGYHREGFFGRNVRLITFIVCMAVILTVLGPWGIDMLVNRSRQEIFGEEVVDKRDLSLDALRMLADMGTDMTWESLQNFNYVDYSFAKEGKTTYIREYEIAGTALILRVGGSSLSGYPDYARLIDYESGDFVEDIRKDPITVFLSEHASN